ncbi:MAG: hypothetical protein A2X67_10595 [Ignavibacteria bacterium GWA2_55_11]|nr:MAG: hypothetical protein A2X67_10595 [Ignavibacteria bacterium GWA2_55_11]OGU43993.1 MAG: hypothetical protein A2X68_02320 [Ignavibacteria bacterium GWC2_56_12]OGU65175.1 MAG: hypothetical protein A3C56_01115 [Ignavibacteria bacterium RIFCSPHIGHO2_02_FULL_56_12]OGU71728.1 MAG: hypothetical protein A3H45_04405 [Ignavibacteria bacterium RIFCSPLOWO2_02_FULL_55_14]OGU73704.1 MAG: hypothetical protein A3G43_01635 [Ignavibacteria bacterium RIFCSPLOWO2_12_FULL_56_21]HAV24258.1 hypothetical protei
MLIDGTEAHCKNHSTKAGVGVCIICAEPVCDSCAVRRKGRTFCPEHGNVHVEREWALVYESSDISDAELAKEVLTEAGFTVVGRDFTPIGYVWDGAGDSAFSRSNLNKRAKIFVHLQEYDPATEALNEWAAGK